jgi:phage N-6-adenine-methyltransferase
MSEKQEACQLFIEQEIEAGLQKGKTPYSIGKELAGWVERLFDAKIKPRTIEQRARRTETATNVASAATSSNNKENQEKQTNQAVMPPSPENQHVPGPGRPLKFSVMPDNTQFRTSGTGENEWYTPGQYIEAARLAMGGIDLDPATSKHGQEQIKAAQYFTSEENGLSKEWYGRVWLNPPYAQPLIYQFIEKLVQEYGEGRVQEAILLVHNYTDTRWFHLAESKASKICFTLGRVRFEKADGTVASPTQGQAFLYYGNNVESFERNFSEYGFIR